MINKEKFNKQMEDYNNCLDKVIQQKEIDDLQGWTLRNVLSGIIKRRNIDSNIDKYDLDMRYIQELIKKENYIELHNELQKCFEEYIPFVLILRFVKKIDKITLKGLCDFINNCRYKFKSNYGQTITFAK